jgi:hypothetical protein
MAKSVAKFGEGLEWEDMYDLSFFMACGGAGGSSRSEKKVRAVKQNLIKANAARKAKAEARRQLRASQELVPPENSSGIPPTR